MILAGTLLLASRRPGPGTRGRPDLLHDGRFQAPAKRSDRSRRNPPGGRVPSSLRHLLDDDLRGRHPELEKRLEKEVELALKVAERAADAGSDPTAALWSGNAHLVLAELRAGQRKSFAAAFEAKRAKKLLERPSAAG